MPDDPQDPADPPAPPFEPPTTPEEFDALARWHDARFQYHAMEAGSHARQRDKSKRIAAKLRRALTTGSKDATVNAMNASEISADAQRSATKSAYKDNRFVQARVANGETIQDVSELLEKRFPARRFHQNTIQGWYVPVGKKSHRDCPADVREFLRDHYGKFTTGEHKGAWRVPLDSWPLERGR